MKWKLSKYITTLLLEDVNTLLVYGGIGSRLIEIPGASIREANEILENPECVSAGSSKVGKLFMEQGILIPENFDELNYLGERYHFSKKKIGNSLSLTICPTLGCNFRCVYCYQHHLGKRMNLETQNKLVAYLDGRSPSLEQLNVTWFGGEPLMAFTTIQNLTNRFMKIKEGKVQYRASMITNGSLLTPKISSQIVDLNIEMVQVTIDGPKRIHDQRRPLKGDRPTFDKIINNLKSADERLKVSLRVNVDSNNVEYMEELLDELDNHGLNGRINLYFAPVIPYTDVCKDVSGQCLELESWSFLQTKLQLMAFERGYGSLGLPNTKTVFCMADSQTSFLVDPDGNFYKCWNDVTQAGKSIFNLYDERRNEHMLHNEEVWNSWDAFQLKECLDCKMLPQCLGGCPYLGIQSLNSSETKKGYCQEIKYNLKARIALHYLNLKSQDFHNTFQNLISLSQRAG